jgi:ammonia channel protein AmtB
VGKQALQLSSGSSDGQISSLGAFNTIVGAYAGAMTFNVANVVLPREGGAGLFRGTVSASSTVKGALVGTVSIASSAAYVQPEYAVLSSVAASALVFVVDYLTKGVNVAGFDCFLMHGFSGFLGAALAGLFPSNRNFRLFKMSSPYVANYVGAFFGNPMQLAKQFVGISFAILLTTVMTVGLYGLVHLVWLPFGGAWEDAPRHDANPVAAVSGPSRAVSGAESAAPLVE